MSGFKLQLDLQCRGIGMETLSQIPPCFLMNGPFNIRKPAWCQQPEVGRTVIFEEIQSRKTKNVENQAFYIIGRNERAHIVLDDLMVSRCHAVLLHNGNGESYLLDLGSSHGTYIGSSRLTPYTPTLIKKCSIIRFGSLERQYILRDYPKVDKILEASKYLESIEEQTALLNTLHNQRRLSAMEVAGRKDYLALSSGSDDGSTDHSDISSLDSTLNGTTDLSFSFTPDCSGGLHRRDTVDYTEALSVWSARGGDLRRSFSFDCYECDKTRSRHAARKSGDMDLSAPLGRKKVRFSESDLTGLAEEASAPSEQDDS